MIYCWDLHKIFKWEKEKQVHKDTEKKTGHMLVTIEAGVQGLLTSVSPPYVF